METNDIPEPLPELEPNPYALTKVEKAVIVACAIGATALLTTVAWTALNLRVQTKRNDTHAATIVAILHTLEDNDIIQNLRIGRNLD
jgi:hypothetical protein